MLLKFDHGQLHPALAEAVVFATPDETIPTDIRGLDVPSDADLEALDLDFMKYSVIRLHFPAFKDGRAFTQARLLRERYGFTGDIRAAGEVLRDQALFMIRCGFTSFELPEGQSAEGFAAALGEYDAFYQAGVHLARPVWQLRGPAPALEAAS